MKKIYEDGVGITQVSNVSVGKRDVFGAKKIKTQDDILNELCLLEDYEDDYVEDYAGEDYPTELNLSYDEFKELCSNPENYVVTWQEMAVGPGNCKSIFDTYAHRGKITVSKDGSNYVIY